MNIRNQRGLSLIELLVSLAIGAFLIIGAVTMQAQTRRTFAVNEQQARLQETARYVLSVVEPEVQMAGLFGFSNQPTVTYNIGGADYVPKDLRMSASAIGGMPGVLNSCGNNWAVDVMAPVQAANNGYGLTCAAQGGGHNGTSDTLTVRRSEMDAAPAATQSKFQLYTNRLNDQLNQFFIGNASPKSITADVSEIRNMIVESYYVALNADNRAGLPALRAKTLTTDGANPVVTDQEVIRGVEDIQVEFGVDPGQDKDGDGAPDLVPGVGVAEFVNGDTARYVPPNNAIVQTGQVVSVRIWVRVRAEEPEQGYYNKRALTYAGVTFTPNDQYRRVLMSRTIFLRNARQWAKS
jgi:type IV pilus assembly protein PilW